MQEKVFQEALHVLPDYDSDEITAAKMAQNLTYSKAVLKETFRLNPVSVGVGRNLNTDLILSGYHVPKGVSVSNLNILSLSLLQIKKLHKSLLFLAVNHHSITMTGSMPQMYANLNMFVLFIFSDDNSDAKLHFMSIGQVF